MASFGIFALTSGVGEGTSVVGTLKLSGHQIQQGNEKKRNEKKKKKEIKKKQEKEK